MNHPGKKSIGITLSILFLLLFALNGYTQMRQLFVDNTQADNDISKISLYSPSTGYIAFNNWIGFTTDSGRSYIKRYISTGNVDYNGFSVNLTFGFGIAGVQAFNASTVVVYGNYGFVPAILYSLDSAKSFKLVYQSQVNAQQLTKGIMDMVFPQNTTTGYAIEADRIIKTTDGARNWLVARSDPGSFFNFLEAVDDNNIFAFSNGKLLKTNDAGATWTPLSVPAGQINYAFFISSQKGWLNIKDNQSIYYTIDGGTTWSQKNNSNITPFQCSKMHFVNDSTGYATGLLYTTMQTTDSGKTWQPLPRDNNYAHLNYGFTELHFQSASQFWAGGGQGFLEMTTNAGGIALPKSYFGIDTTGTGQTNVVALNNYSKHGYQYEWLVNGIQISTSYNCTYNHILSRQSDSVVLIVGNGKVSDTTMRVQQFLVPDLPNVTLFYPASGSEGTVINIYGSGFGDVTSVMFGGVAADSFTIVSPTQITATVGSGASGNIVVTDIHGSYAKSGFTFNVAPSSPPPVINSFSPVFGSPGTTVTITGNNFSPIAANNIIYFGATKTVAVTATATQVTCKVPSGGSYEPVSLLNTTTHLSGASLKPFSLTFADSSNFTGNSFTDIYNFNSRDYIYTKNVMGKDLDGDGKPDVIALTQRYGGDTILAFRNNASGTNFSFEPSVGVGSIISGGSGKFDVQDLDGDGKPDVVSVMNIPYLDVRRNNSSPGQIKFDPGIILPCAGYSVDVKLADIDNDGRNDIITATYGVNYGMSVIRNTSVPGSLSFAAATNYFNAGGGTIALAVGDLDGDGKKDVISYGDGYFSCYRNTSSPGKISFATHLDFTVAGGTLAVVEVILADFDNDGKPDVVITNDNNYYAIFRNTSTTGNISFAPVKTLSYGTITQGGCVGNLSGGVNVDYAAGGGLANGVSVMKNRSIPGSIRTDSLQGLGLFSNPYYSNTCDFNGDGKTDLIVSSPSQSAFMIFQNNIGVPVEFTQCLQGGGSIYADVSGYAYQWQQNTGSGFRNILDTGMFAGTNTAELKFTKAPWSTNGYTYRCKVDSLYSSAFRMRVIGVEPTIVITAPDSVVCNGTAITFTAGVNNPGTGPAYRWQVNGIDAGTNSNTFTAANLKNNDQVRAILSGTNPCSDFVGVFMYDTSNVIRVIISGDSLPLTIKASATSICAGSAVYFKAVTPDTARSLSYQWLLNGTDQHINTDSFTISSLADGDRIQALVVSSAGCSAPSQSNAITMQVRPAVTPAVSISGRTDSICTGTPVTLVANASDTGTTVNYQWQKNGNAVGFNKSAYTDNGLINGDIILVRVITNADCAVSDTVQSNALTMGVIEKAIPNITISGATTTTYPGGTMITATVTGPGNPRSFSWQDSTKNHGWQSNDLPSSDTISYIPQMTGDEIRCITTLDNIPCIGTASDTSNTLIFTIKDSTTTLPNSTGAIRIYPNPVQSTIYLDSIPLTSHYETLIIIGMNGGAATANRSIINQTSLSVDVASLPGGLYIIQLKSKSGASVFFKFIKF